MFMHNYVALDLVILGNSVDKCKLKSLEIRVIFLPVTGTKCKVFAPYIVDVMKGIVKFVKWKT